MSTPAPPRQAGRVPGRTRPWPPALSAVPALVFALLTWQVLADGPLLRTDERVSRWLVRPDRAGELLSDLGDVQVALPVLLVVAAYVARRGRAAGLARWWLPPVAALVCLALVPLVVVPVKDWTDRPGTPVEPPATGYFPSGHTATALLAYGGAVLVLLPWLRSGRARRGAVAAGALLVLGVSYGLVRRGFHWPLDVVASWCLGAVLLGALGRVVRRAQADHAKPAHPGPALLRPGQTSPPGAAPTVDPERHSTSPMRKGRDSHMPQEPVVGAAHAFWLAGRQATGTDTFEVTSPWDGRTVATVSVPTDAQTEEAVAAAYAVREDFAATPAHVRAAALDHVSRRLAERTEEIARLISAENGKPIKWARGEVGRAVSVFRFAAEEARRFNGGEAQRLDTDAGGQGRLALTRRFPKGVVLGIAPFNFPLNLCAHKVAPAIAAGAPIILKPAPATPLSGLILGELLAETDLPAGSWSILPVPNDRMADLVQDERLPVISFTGSEKVGYAIMDSVPRKHCTLELGGNGAAVVLADYASDADLDWAATRIATFSNYQGGQSCISVQRVIADAAVYDRLLPRIVAAVEAQVTGDPADDATDVGPLVSEDAAKRVESWVSEAVEAGAQLLTGGKRDGASYAPTVLTDVPAGTTLSCEEVFGPVLTVQKVDGEAEAFAAVNDSKYGLQAGVFTHDLQVAFRAHRALEVGGVVIGDVPSYRADQMPYGGAKQSGVGREGVRFAMEDYTYERVLVLTGLAL
ncbi:hypothetical protein GCM10010335_47460 [Streptomyces galbus]|uniref:Aldehyde dehydrogenase family protein n=2 Tax=Streptomyces galbus TaxID=33898 RepID=A0A4U5W939_STRGB|nr:aldehyde dehydrogenase family protein [Streptomyces galbus]GHD43631.1 hypothetical protein GCM10010335_47460 [Streptomyces galbus]